MTGPNESIFVIRLGAMGDILHALPAVSSLKASFPRASLSWLVARKWLPLLTGNPAIDKLIPFDRTGLNPLLELRQTLRALQPEIAIDFQGLVQSAIAGRMSRPARFFGFDRSVARETLACRLYSDPVRVVGPHRIERNIQLAQAAGATRVTENIWLPPGAPEGDLPALPYVLASPFAGWASKQWPLDFYDQLALKLKDNGLDLILNVPQDCVQDVRSLRHVVVQNTTLPGLIYATRHATAVIGVDSGPLHLAAALKKPGVALFGPTDPAQTGPFNNGIAVLRHHSAETTYKRGNNVHSAMASISVDEVAHALHRSLAASRQLLAAVPSR